MGHKSLSREKARILVIGCGSIGKRHIRNLQVAGAREITAFDPREDRRREAGEGLGIRVFADLEAAFAAGPDAVFVCSPTAFHREQSLRAVAAGSHVFIEKPVSDSLEGMDTLMEVVDRQGLVSLVGCNFRFHPGLRQVKSLLNSGSIGRTISFRARFGHYLPDWHPWEDYRKTYSARRDLGGGVILDRVHEIDYARWLFGDVRQVFSWAGHESSLEIDTEDTAEILLGFRNGITGSLHLDYLRRRYDAGLEVTGEEGIIQWSYQNHTVTWYEAGKGSWQSMRWPGYDGNKMYLDEVMHFLAALEGGEQSVNPVPDAVRVLEIALAAKRSSTDGCVVNL
ncbi:MAG TPA: Gfo/Idh/MocA family oxidoreductase [Methanomicrobiales archaeon]|nr:Gfo/Idh/MocA family oxidoreductase [Methanomicrobiales archaeon]